MAREIPEVVRAVAGLAATVLDEARKLPQELPELPVRLIGQAMQVSLKLQQHYSGLVARGDEVLTGLRGHAEPGLATFDDDLPAPPAPAGARSPRSSAFDRVGDLPADTVAEELADELADDLAVAGLPLADPDDVAAVLAAGTGEDLGPAEVAALPDDPIADAVTAVVDELAAEVAEEITDEVPDAVPDEVLEDLTADAVTEVADEEAAVDEAVAEELIADAAVGGAPPAPEVHSVEDLTPDEAPEQTELIDDPAPDVSALADAEEEFVDLGGLEAAESPTPDSGGSDTGGTLGDPLVPPARSATRGGTTTGSPATGTSPVEGYDSLTIPALRSRLRSYPTETVADLLDYERSTRARAPYVTLLQNRLEKLSNDRG